MNRTPLLNHPNSLIPTVPQQLSGFGDRVVDVLSRPETPSLPWHCLFSPQQYEPGYAYPLVVWMHSNQSSESELRQVMPLLSTQNYVGVAPRGTRKSLNFDCRYDWDESAGYIAEACERVRECVNLAKQEFHIHSDRIFIAGFGTGGTMALRVGLQYPELFAGAVSLGGRVPRGQNAFGRLNAARRLPILLSVSPVEGEFTLADVKSDLRLLHSGGFTVETQLFPAGDSLTDSMLCYCNAWIMRTACPHTVCTHIAG